MSAVIPSGASKQNRGSSKMKWVVVVGVLVAIAVYLGVVILNENLRRDYFVQRITTLILILGVVVVLFAVFRNVAAVHLPAGRLNDIVQPGLQGAVITLAGAAAFFYILLGPIKDLIFPKDQTISGNIYYKVNQPDEGYQPVPGVIVQVPETDQRSQPTSQDGRFTITNLSFHPEDLNAMYSGLTYPFDPSKYQRGRYDVIRRPAVTPPSQRTTIAATEWIESGNKCPSVNTTGYSKVALFVLQKSFPVLPGYGTMMIKVNTQSPAQIIDAQKEKPDSEGFEDQLQEARTLTRQWSLPARGNQADVKLTLCLGRKGPGPPPARNALTTAYWFER